MTNSLHLPSLALMMCVRDEAELLAANLAYHHQMGVERAYVFLDRCTDNTPEIARSFSWVMAIEQDRHAEDRFMSAHQIRCMNAALALAHDDGVEWLLHVDADEFACGDERPHSLRIAAQRLGQFDAACGNLQAMLARVSPDTEMVILHPIDAVPTPIGDHAPFWEHHYYQTRGILNRPLLDPTTGEIRILDNPLGHDKGKSIVRTSAHAEAVNAHRWTARGEERELRSENRGFHYHFVVTSAPQWQAKYRKFAEYPAHWQKGNPVRFPKQAWKEASMRMSEQEAAEYYNRWVVVPPRQLMWPMLKGQVIYDTFVEDTLRHLNVI